MAPRWRRSTSPGSGFQCMDDTGGWTVPRSCSAISTAGVAVAHRPRTGCAVPPSSVSKAVHGDRGMARWVWPMKDPPQLESPRAWRSHRRSHEGAHPPLEPLAGNRRLVLWWTQENPEKISGSVRYAMKPTARSGKRSSAMSTAAGRHHRSYRDSTRNIVWRGDLWIDSIAITDGPRASPCPGLMCAARRSSPHPDSRHRQRTVP